MLYLITWCYIIRIIIRGGEDVDNNIIATQISYLRNKYGMTQEDLAVKIGVSKQTVSNWETGLKTPRMGAIQNLSDLFNVTKSYIIEGSEDSSNEITSIYNQLDSQNKKEVINFAKFKLNHQQNQDKENIVRLDINSDDLEDNTLAAHLVDPEKEFTSKEIDSLKEYLNNAKKEYFEKRNK